MSLMQKINHRLCAVFVKQKHVSLKQLKSYVLCDAVRWGPKVRCLKS